MKIMNFLNKNNIVLFFLCFTINFSYSQCLTEMSSKAIFIEKEKFDKNVEKKRLCNNSQNC